MATTRPSGAGTGNFSSVGSVPQVSQAPSVPYGAQPNLPGFQGILDANGNLLDAYKISAQQVANNYGVDANGYSIDPSTFAVDPNSFGIKNSFGIDPSKFGIDQNGYSISKFGDVTMDPEALNRIKEQAYSTNPSAWTQLALQKQQLTAQNAMDSLAKQNAGSNATALANLSRLGGMNSGAAERLNTDNMKQNAFGQNALLRQGMGDVNNIYAQDQAQKQQLLQSIPGFQEAEAQLKLQNQNQQQAANIYNTSNRMDLAKLNEGNQIDLSKFNANQGQQLAEYNTGNQIDLSKFNTGNQIDLSKFNTGTSADLAKFNKTQGQQLAEYNNSILQNTDQANVTNKLTGLAGLNAFNAGTYSDQMKAFGAGKTADASIVAARESHTWLCTEATKVVPMSLEEKKCLPKILRYSSKVAREATQFYLAKGNILVKKMKEAGADWQDNAVIIRKIIKMVELGHMKEAFAFYWEHTFDLVNRYWPDCQEPAYLKAKGI